MSDIKGSRLLRKSFGSVMAGLTGEGWVLADNKSSWELYTNNAGATFAVVRGYFDLAGWSSEYLTAFISGAGWQESDNFYVPWATIGPAPVLKTWDIVSKSYINDESLEDAHWLDSGNMQCWSAPGMLDSNYSLEEIFAGRQRNFTPDNTTAYAMTQTMENLWGAGDATAGDKIYITRIVRLTGLQEVNGVVGIPDFNVIVPAVLADEKDLVYMERLRRSYVLAESRNP